MEARPVQQPQPQMNRNVPLEIQWCEVTSCLCSKDSTAKEETYTEDETFGQRHCYKMRPRYFSALRLVPQAHHGKIQLHHIAVVSRIRETPARIAR